MLALVVSILASAPAFADTWLRAKTEVYVSPDGRHRLTVTPREVLRSSYFSDAVKGVKAPGQKPGSPAVRPMGVLERADADGGWSLVWKAELVNDVAPVSALVAPSGDYVVTFDNWFMAGYGPDTVVIYGPGGKRIRAFGLDAFLSKDWIDALPHSVSSIVWKGQPRIEGDRLILSLLAPNASHDRSDWSYVEVSVDLASGVVTKPATAEWRRLEAKATAIATSRRRAQAAARERFLAQQRR